MRAWLEVSDALESLVPHLASVSLVVLRLGPAAFLCPLLGGPFIPSVVRWSLVLSLALFFHMSCRVGFDVRAPTAGMTWTFCALREALFGIAIGLVAALPWDVARTCGRFIDVFRGSSVEVVRPGVGNREAASGEVLHQCLVVGCASSWGLPLLLSGLTTTFARVKIGVPMVGEGWVLKTFELAGTALAMGLMISGPFIATALALDCVMGLLAKTAPQLNLAEVSTPLKVLGGGALLWASLSVLTNALFRQAAQFPDALQTLLERVP